MGERLIKISLELAQEFGLIDKHYYRTNPAFDFKTYTVVVSADELDKRASEYADKAIEEWHKPPKTFKQIYEDMDRLAEKWVNAMVRNSDFY